MYAAIGPAQSWNAFIFIDAHRHPSFEGQFGDKLTTPARSRIIHFKGQLPSNALSSADFSSNIKLDNSKASYNALMAMQRWYEFQIHEQESEYQLIDHLIGRERESVRESRRESRGNSMRPRESKNKRTQKSTTKKGCHMKCTQAEI